MSSLHVEQNQPDDMVLNLQQKLLERKESFDRCSGFNNGILEVDSDEESNRSDISQEARIPRDHF